MFFRYDKTHNKHQVIHQEVSSCKHFWHMVTRQSQSVPRIQILEFEKIEYTTHIPVMNEMCTKFEVDPSWTRVVIDQE